MNARDAALLRRWSEHRDAEAFNDLVSHYADMVYATCKRTLGNPSDAEELTQECFLKLATGKVRIRTSLGGWLHSAATSLSINRLRADARRRKREEIAVAASPSTAEPTWDDIQRYVDEAIAELPERLREPVIRHFLQRETHDQIAQDLGVTRSTVTKRIANGIERVRERLSKGGVLLTAAALTTLASERMAEAAPAALKAALGRLALSGVAQSAVVATTGMTLLTKVLASVAVAVIAGTGATIAYQQHDSPAPPASRQEAVAVTPTADAAQTKQAQRDAQPAPSTPAAVTAANSEVNSGTVSGRVYDKETLKGIPGAKIMLTPGVFYLYAKTNERGEYRFENLPASTWRPYCTRANGYYTGAENPEQGEKNVRKLKLERGGSLTGIDFALGRGEGLRGVVVDAAGKPVAGALVTASTAADRLLISNTSESREDGSFFVSGFPPKAVLYVWADKDALVSVTGGPYALPQEDRSFDPVVLQREAVLRGIVQDKRGKPVAGLKVTPSLMPKEAYREFEVLSGSDGRFELKGMPAGETMVRVCCENNIVNDPCPSITLAAGQVVNDLTLTCTAGSLSISGQVVDSKGVSLSEAMVQGWGGETPQNMHAFTRSDGKFRFEKLEAGTYKLMVLHQKHLRLDNVEVAAGDNNVRLVMPDGISVEGRVVDADTGKPVPAYEIMYCRSPEEMVLDDRYEKTQNPEGTFKLAVAQFGNIRIAARVEGYLLGHVDVTVVDSRPVVRDVVIRLKPQANLRGKVHDAKGTPIAGAGVFSGKSRQNGNNSFASALTGGDGSFVLPAHKLGDDYITVRHPNFGSGQAILEQKHYAGEPIDVTVPSGTALACTVLTDGAPCMDAYVHVYPIANPDDDEMLQTRPNGTCRFDSLSAEQYYVLIQLPRSPQAKMDPGNQESGARQERIVSLAAGLTTELSVDFAVGDASITGEVEGPARLESIILSVKNAQGEQEYHSLFSVGTQDAGSSYSISNLPAGEATMMVFCKSPNHEIKGNLSRRYTFTLTPGAAIRQDVRLEGGAAFWGTLRPMPPGENVNVYVLYGRVGPEDTISQGHARSFYGAIGAASDGTFRQEGYQPGTYTLVPLIFSKQRARSAWIWEAATVVELGAQDQEVNLQLPK